jgi:hypothetical protein
MTIQNTLIFLRTHAGQNIYDRDLALSLRYCDWTLLYLFMYYSVLQ